jgi:hypothetical protein
VCNENELTMPDKRSACILAATTVAQEVGADPQATGERQFWTLGNNADPGFPADPDTFPPDAMGDDGRSAGPFQQQGSGPGDARPWCCSDQTAVP